MTLEKTYEWVRTGLSDEDGAITVDFVVITAFVVGITIAVMTSLGGATHDQAQRIDAKFDETGIGTY